MTLSNCKLIEIPNYFDTRGCLSVVESNRGIPFDIKRIYYLYNIPAGKTRAAHGHLSLHQLMIAINGSFNVLLDDGSEKREIKLNKPSQGLYICPLIWRDLYNFSDDAVCMVLASEFYDEADYFRNYQDFLSFVNGN